MVTHTATRDNVKEVETDSHKNRREEEDKW